MGDGVSQSRLEKLYAARDEAEQYKRWWIDAEKRISKLEAERADLRQRLIGGVELVRSGRYLTAWAEENAKYLKEKTPSRPIANSRMERFRSAGRSP